MTRHFDVITGELINIGKDDSDEEESEHEHPKKTTSQAVSLNSESPSKNNEAVD